MSRRWRSRLADLVLHGLGLGATLLGLLVLAILLADILLVSTWLRGRYREAYP